MAQWTDNRTTKRRTRSRVRLQPIQPVNLVSPDGLRFLAQAEVTPASVGHKAFGLAALPPGWTLPFFVVDGACDFSQNPRFVAAGRHLRSELKEAIEQLAVPAGTLLIIRSSGADETLSRRGAHESITCRPDQVAAMLSELKQRRSGGRPEEAHWVVQSKAATREQGHLSNERRLREEPRDWVVELEPHQSETVTSQIDHLSVRQWRDGSFSPTDRLQCGHNAELAHALKQVAQWGMQFMSRLHFEWVWDGSYLSIVQADVEEDSSGIDPVTVIAQDPGSNEVGALRHFRVATSEDCKSFRKLRNAATYAELGYLMPPFYVMNEGALIDQLLRGEISDELAADLTALAIRPLIIRVDGRSVPAEKREMLPRSDELRSIDGAREWLTGKFAEQVRSSGLENCDLCLIAHHFIPAVSSAWARAEPNSRWVRIESLWGVPEGLYWYSHDTFEVDTLAAIPEGFKNVSREDFIIRERRRFKGIFIAPDSNGEWIAQNTRPPYDWRRSIAKEKWLREIAATTREIATRDTMPVSVMWLVDVKPPLEGQE